MIPHKCVIVTAKNLTPLAIMPSSAPAPTPSDTHAKASPWRGLAIRVGIVGAVWVLVGLGQDRLVDWFSVGPCHWKQIMGFPCPGCHGTRAALALFRGDILGSLKHNFWPVVFAAVVLMWAISPRTAKRLFGWANRHWVLFLVFFLILWVIQWARNIIAWQQGL